MADNNPRNRQSPLFRRLTRLFSGPIVTYRTGNVKKNRAPNYEKYTFTSSTGREFKKKEYYNPFEGIYSKILNTTHRDQRYNDFDQMEYTPEIASTLDVYADEISTSSDISPIVQIDCMNEEIKMIIHTLLYNVLNVEFNMFGWARNLCKYGDFFLYLDVDDHLGITNVIPLPVKELERIEGTDPTNPNYVQYYWPGGGEAVTFENWQVAHFRVLGNDKYVPYGTSVLEPARRIWRQLSLLEDAMIAYRVVRSPERRVFYIDIGNMPPNEVEQYIESVKTQMKRAQIVDEDTGRVDLRYNAMSIDEDYYIPSRGGQSSRIETLPGGQFTSAIEDVQYLRDKLFSALKIPKAYLAQSDSMEDKTTLAQKDIRFARTIQRLQRVIISELEKMIVVHLYTLGYRGDDLTSFKLFLNNPSRIAELQELEHMRTKFEIAGNATESYFSRRWVYKNIFKLDDYEIGRVQEEQFQDAKQKAIVEKAAELAVGEYEAAVGGEAGDAGDLGGDLGGDEGGGDLGGDLGGGDEAGGDEAGGEEAAEPETGDLLAEPGMRDDGYLTPGSKGKVYYPVKNAGKDKRSNSGPRSRSYKMQGRKETNTRRSNFPGSSGLSTLGIGVTERLNKDETLLIESKKTTFEIGRLIKELEIKDGDKVK
mgnify:FL=1